MKVLSVESSPEKAFAWVTFGRDDHRAPRKAVRVRQNVHPDGSAYSIDENRKHAALCFMKAAREADRDIAYQLHGENFREHCEMKSNFWAALTEEEWAPLLASFQEALK